MTTHLRYVHSGVFTDDWDNQYDGATQHTDFYLHTLGQYLRYFPGVPATYVTANGPDASKSADGFETLYRAMGLGSGVAEGDSVHVTGPEEFVGVIDYLRPNFLGIRTGDGLYCFFGRNAFGAPVGLSHHLFADEVDLAATEQAWSDWLESVYT